MKYIRTKDCVYEVTKDTKGTKFIVMGKNKTLLDYGTFISSEADVIKEAETIEELCDEFVFVNKIGNFDKSHVIRYNIPNHRFTEPAIEEKIEAIEAVYKDELDKIRGAIYTDKGLIYVAKMNEKGELELLWKTQ